MEKRKRGRPPKNKSKITKKVPGKRGRPPKQKAHIESNTMDESENTSNRHEHFTREGQKTKCKKCGIEMTMHVQPLLSEEKLSNALCFMCGGTRQRV